MLLFTIMIISKSFHDTIVLSDILFSYPAITNELVIVDRLVFANTFTIGSSNVLPISDKLVLRSLASYKFNHRRVPVNNTLSLQQTVTIEIRGKLPPLSVPGSTTVIAQQTCSTEFPIGNNISLTWETLTLYLPAPKLGNKDHLELNRIQKKNRGNELIIFADPSWPKALKIDYEFDTLTQDQVRVLQGFVEKSFGKLVTMTDFEGIIRSGVIVSPELEIKQQGTCDFLVSFSFQQSF